MNNRCLRNILNIRLATTCCVSGRTSRSELSVSGTLSAKAMSSLWRPSTGNRRAEDGEDNRRTPEGDPWSERAGSNRRHLLLASCILHNNTNICIAVRQIKWRYALFAIQVSKYIYRNKEVCLNIKSKM